MVPEFLPGGRGQRLFMGLSTLLLAAVLCIRLNAPFRGAMEAQGAYQALAALNHLGYGLGVTKGLPSLAPPGLEPRDLGRHWWINHPPLACLPTVLCLAALGDSVAAVRLSGILWAVLTLPLVGFLATRLRSPAAGRWAVVSYAAAGLVLWDARRPEYFQPALFLMMLGLSFHVAWLERPTRAKWAGVVACVVLGCFVDWMGYFFGAALALHLFLQDRRHHWVRAAVLVGLLPACFALFLLHVTVVTGSGAISYLTGVLANRTTADSHWAAAGVQGAACFTHLGAASTLAALLTFAVPGTLEPRARGVLWMLAGYGLASSQFLVGWTAHHAYVAAWFLFPAIVLGFAFAVERLLSLISRPWLHRGAAALVTAAVIGQGAAYAVYRHRQDTWYRPTREFVAVVREHVNPGTWVATPLAPMTVALETYETRCNLFWSVSDGRQLREILDLGRPVAVLMPRPDAAGFWKDMTPEGRERAGIRPMSPALGAFLESQARGTQAGPYTLYLLGR